MDSTIAVRLVGTGSYLPETVRTNADLAKMVDTSDEWIVTRTGIRQRHIARDDQASSHLGAEACRKALADADDHAGALAAYEQGILVAQTKGDIQAAKEMTVFAKRIRKALAD